MRAIIEIEITGDFEEPLTNDGINDILTAVICDGADSVALTGRYVIKEIIE
jgi:hypothetical protein